MELASCGRHLCSTVEPYGLSVDVNAEHGGEGKDDKLECKFEHE